MRAVLLDAGNTLVEIDWDAAAACLAAEGTAVEPEALRLAAGRVRPELDRRLAAARDSTESPATRNHWLTLVFDHLALPAGAPRERATAALLAVLGRLWYRPCEGAAEALAELKRRGARLAVVSNSDGRIHELLARAGLFGHFDAVVDSGAVGIEKPDPRIFHLALDRLGARPDEAVHVGDLPSIDVAGARAAGVRPILIDPFDGFPDAGADRIRSLAELPDLL